MSSVASLSPGRLLEAKCPGLLAESVNRGSTRAGGRLAVAAEASGTTHGLIELRSVALAARLARGERETADAAAVWLIEAARQSGAADMIVLALAPAAMTLADRGPVLLAELEQAPGARETTYDARQLPGLSRTALAAEDPRWPNGWLPGSNPATRLTSTRSARLAPSSQSMRTTMRTRRLSTPNRPNDGHEFGTVPERAYALLGQGRCLLALRRPEAEQPLREARDLFAAMGYRPALVETESLLERITAAPAS